jgi:23S rRNA G2069 N7-methylase RlmK/C1962 C5-methylase RlmI
MLVLLQGNSDEVCLLEGDGLLAVSKCHAIFAAFQFAEKLLAKSGRAGLQASV